MYLAVAFLLILTTTTHDVTKLKTKKNNNLKTTFKNLGSFGRSNNISFCTFPRNGECNLYYFEMAVLYNIFTILAIRLCQFPLGHPLRYHAVQIPA